MIEGLGILAAGYLGAGVTVFRFVCKTNGSPLRHGVGFSILVFLIILFIWPLVITRGPHLES